MLTFFDFSVPWVLRAYLLFRFTASDALDSARVAASLNCNGGFVS